MDFFRQVKLLTNKYQLYPSKQLGQNFLIRESALNFIKQEICPEKNKNYIEVGAGFLFLTNIIAQSGGKIIAIEKDKRFANFYKDAKYDNVDIILEDALKVDFSALDAGELFGNIPYNISTDLLLKVIRADNINRAVLLLQKEFAMRILSNKNNKSYSSITILTDFFFEKHFLKTFPPHFFYPKPRVSSTLIGLTKKEVDKEIDQELFFRVVRTAFSQRRKKILNSLSSGFNRENMERALNLAGIPSDIRAESLSVEDYIKLYKSFKNS